MLDSPQSCIKVLSDCAQELGEFGAVWAENAGELKHKLLVQERLTRAALIDKKVTGTSKEIREAQAAVLVEEMAPNLAEEIEELEKKVTDFGVRFKRIDKHASIAQSVLAAYRSEAKMGDHNADLAWSNRG
jgi:hypothetical protein